MANASQSFIPTKLLYKYVHLDNLEAISQQALEIIHEAKLPKTSWLYYLDGLMAERDRFRLIPELCDSLKKINVFKHWLTTSIVVLYDSKMPIHLDDGVTTAINIPVANCEGTYTVFYKCEGEQSLIRSKRSTDTNKDEDFDVSYYGYKESVCKEIGRIELVKPAFLNVHVPHTVRVAKKVPRIVISVRLNVSPVEFLNG